MRQLRSTTAIAGLVATLVAANLLSGLSGCSAAPHKPIPLTVAVFQQRTDYAIRGAQIEVTNPSSLDVQVTSATFASSWFTATMSSPSTPTTLRSKSTTDLRLLLAAPVCTADRAAPVVQLRYTRPDGSHGEAIVTPTIPFDSISLVHTQDCAQLDFEKVARITIAPTLRFDPAVATDGNRAALIDVTFTPTGASGSVTLHSTEDTTLLAQREGAIRRIELSLTAASPPTTITLDYTPVGCVLKHRLAEDKVGTLIPLRVDAGEYRDALFSVPLSAAMKAALMNWVGVYCGW
ncbi:MAG: hypothetical protein HIU88_10465 [Acidobacteria bacterium]|nr:hypothetical protein [Acidobacteriota bacterium]